VVINRHTARLRNDSKKGQGEIQSWV
jgi:hypothetical protein